MFPTVAHENASFREEWVHLQYGREAHQERMSFPSEMHKKPLMNQFFDSTGAFSRRS